MSDARRGEVELERLYRDKWVKRKIMCIETAFRCKIINFTEKTNLDPTERS